MTVVAIMLAATAEKDYGGPNRQAAHGDPRFSEGTGAAVEPIRGETEGSSMASGSMNCDAGTPCPPLVNPESHFLL